MQSIKKYLLILALLLSCATKKDQEFVDLDSNEAEKNLSIDKSKLDDFKVKKISQQKIEAPQKIKKKKQNFSQLPEEKSEKGVTSQVAPAERPGRSYPKDYPKDFKSYDKLAKEAWELFNPTVFLGEKFTFEVSYLGITAGHIQMETMPIVEINDKKAFHFKARMRSARYYSYIYTLDDSLETFTSVEDFIPMKYVLMQRESAQKVDDLQLFDRSKLKTYHFYKRLKRGKRKELELEKPIPYFFQDSYSALHFVRGFPLKEGDHYEFPIVTRGKIWILKIKVEGKEIIDVNGNDVKAIRLNAQTRFPGVLEKKGDIIFWYSADKLKRLLKFEAQVKIGAVAGELVDYKAGKALENL